MRDSIVEECSSCMKGIEFASEEERVALMNAYIGEILCVSCLKDVGHYD